jgi:hypothetical protein
MSAWRYMRLVPVLAVLALAFSSCAKRITDSNLSRVRTDMSLKEVESILGQPNRTSSHEIESPTLKKTAMAVTYFYEQNGRVVELRFVNDKLAEGGKIGVFGD